MLDVDRDGPNTRLDALDVTAGRTQTVAVGSAAERYLARAPPPPPAVEHLRVRTGVTVALVTVGGAVLVVTVHRAGGPAPRPGGLTPPAGP